MNRRQNEVIAVGFGIGFAPGILLTALVMVYGSAWLGIPLLNPPHVAPAPQGSSALIVLAQLKAISLWAVGLLGLTMACVYGPMKAIRYLGGYIVARFWREFKETSDAWSTQNLIRKRTKEPEEVRDARRKLARYETRPRRLTEDWFWSGEWIAGYSKEDYLDDLKETVAIWDKGI